MQRQHRRDPEHHRQHRDHRHQRREQLAHRLLEALADVVDVVGDPAEHLAAGRAVEVGQRQPVDLLLDVLAHPADGVLHDPVEDVALQPRQQRRRDVHRERQQQHPADGVEVDALAGDHVVHRRQHVGEVVVAAGAEPLDRLRLGAAGRDLAAEQAGEDEVGGVAEDPRAGRHQRDADDAEQHHEHRRTAVRSHPGQQALGGRAEVHRLLADHAAAHRAAARAGALALDPLGRLEAGLLGRRLLGLLGGAHAGPLRRRERSEWRRGVFMPPPPRTAGTRRSPGRSRTSGAAPRGCRGRRPGRPRGRRSGRRR